MARGSGRRWLQFASLYLFGQPLVPELVLEADIFQHRQAIHGCQQAPIVVFAGYRVQFLGNDALGNGAGICFCCVPFVEDALLVFVHLRNQAGSLLI